MNDLASIVSCGIYVPRLRLERAHIAQALQWLGPPAAGPISGTRAVCNWDEDSLTMAVEAGRRCLAEDTAAGCVPAALDLASTTLPFADRSNATLVASALDLPDSTRARDSSGSLRAGTTALAEAAARREAAATLIIASDARLAQPGSAQELQFGAGAAALLVTGDPQREGPAPRATIRAAAHLSADFVDHYRMGAERFDYTFEERWVRDEGFMKLVTVAIARALAAAQTEAEAVQYLVMPGPAVTVKRVAQASGLANVRLQDSLREDCGDAGTAHPLLLLAGVLETATCGERILLVGFGQGVDALVLVAAQGAGKPARLPIAQVLGRRKLEQYYTRYLAHNGLLEPYFGMRAERDNRTAQSVAWRKHRQTTAFIGGRCAACGTVQFPKARVCVNPDCRRADTQVDHRLAGTTGRVKSFTEDWQAYSPRPPYIYGNVDLESGGNLLMEFTDVEPGELQVDDSVKFVFRVKDIDRLRSYKRYFWKATKI